MKPTTGPARVGLILLAVLTLTYAPMALTATAPYFGHGWGNVETWLTGFLPGGSVARQSVADSISQRMAPYTNSLAPIVLHTVTGAGIMILGPWQLWTGATGRARKHRLSAGFYLAAVILSMAGAFLYLVRTPWTQVFSGPVFALGLWGFWLMVVVSTTLGILAIRRRAIDRHLRWMVFGFTALLSAPILRVGWTSIMAINPRVPLDKANIYISSMVFPICTMLAFGGVRLLDRRRRGALARRPTTVSRGWLMVCAAIGFVGFAILALVSFTWSAQWAPTQIYFSAGYLGSTAISGYLLLHALAEGRRGAAQEWRLAVAAQVIAPAVGMMLSTAFLALGLDSREAVMAGVGVAPGVATFAAFVRADLLLRRAAASRPASGRREHLGAGVHREVGVVGDQSVDAGLGEDR